MGFRQVKQLLVPFANPRSRNPAGAEGDTEEVSSRSDWFRFELDVRQWLESQDFVVQHVAAPGKGVQI